MFGFILTGVQTLIVTSCNRARGWFWLVGLRVDLKILCLERIENHIKLSTSSITDFTFLAQLWCITSSGDWTLIIIVTDQIILHRY